MRFSAIVLLLSCWLLQPIQAALPEPAPPLKLIIDQSDSLVSMAYDNHGTAFLFKEDGLAQEERQVVGGTLKIVRGDVSVSYKLPVTMGAVSSRYWPFPVPYWRQILALGPEGTCLVAGRRLCDLCFVPEEKAAADFPDLVPLVRQACAVEESDRPLAFAWVSQAKDRLLLLTSCLKRASDKGEEMLYYLVKGRKPLDFRFSDGPLMQLYGTHYFSAKALFLEEGGCVFLCRDGQSLVVFPAAQGADAAWLSVVMKLQCLCTGMARQGKDRQGNDRVRLLIAERKGSTIGTIAYNLHVTQAGASLKKVGEVSYMRPIPVATSLGQRYWVHPTTTGELILWSETKGRAAAPLVSNIHMGDRQWHESWWQVADHGRHRRILYWLAVNKEKRAISSIDMPPATLFRKAGKLKKAAVSFPVRGPRGTAGFYVAETSDKGTFFPCRSDGSHFSLEEGYATSLPLPFRWIGEIKQVAGWFCPEKKGRPCYLALAIEKDKTCAIYRLKVDASAPAFDQIKWIRQSDPCFECLSSGVSFMQWMVDEESEQPVLIYLARGATSHLKSVRGFPGRCKLREEKELGLFSYLGEGNLAGIRIDDKLRIYRLRAKGGELTAASLFEFSPESGLYPQISALVLIQEKGIEKVLVGSRDRGETKVWVWTSDTQAVYEYRDCLLPSDFDACYIGNTATRPCVIVKDRSDELSLLHFVPGGHLLVTGYLRRLKLKVEELVPDMIRLLVRSLGGASLAFQEQTSWRPALFTWSSHFAPFAFVTHKKNRDVGGKCRALVTS